MKLLVEFEKGVFEFISARGFRVVEQETEQGTVLMAEPKNCEEGHSHIPMGNIRGASTH